MLQEPLTVIDLEATGLAIEQGDRLTEIGVVRVAGGRIVDSRQSLVNCGARIPAHITAYTGISQAMVDGAPPVGSVLADLLLFLGDTPVVAHGARFDEALLRAECDRIGLPLLTGPFVCSLALARAVYPNLPNHSLAALSHALGLERSAVAHRADADAATTAQLLLRMARDVAARTGRRTLGLQELVALVPGPAPLLPAIREVRYA